ncbi:TPA: hypothetical protein ACH3X3_006417 [Trebouxia sp. C0006]
MTASSRRLPAAHILLSDSLYSIACCAFPSTRNSTLKATAPSTVAPALTPALSPASGPLAADCEHNTLRLLGWQQAYSPRGYTINTQLCSSCSTATWQALGCLKTLTNLTLTGSLPDLPDAWGANDSFPALQAMHFSFASLAGTLPSSWGLDMALPQLQTMDFSMTQLSGQLPSTWGQRGALQQLKALHLSQVNIAGTIPFAWGEVDSFPALSSLQLGGPLLNGTLPAHWGSNGTLSGLVDLEIANSNFLGTLPQEWGAPDAFKNLSTLSLTNCNISGTLPDSWAGAAAFPLLTALTLADLPFQAGTLPAAWANNASFPQLSSLQLGLDELDRPVPYSWQQPGAFPALTSLDLSICQLTGTLPSSWPPMLQTLDVSDNNFTGTLPAGLASLDQLQQLTLSANLFSGELPAAWGAPGAFQQLTYLEFSSIDVTGGLPAAWGSPHSFQQIQVLYCQDSVSLGGTLPESWASPGAFSNVQEMILYNSPIGGTIPASWGFPDAKLQRLNLGSSSLQGNISAYYNATLAGLDLDDCKLDGSLGMFWSSSAPLQAVSLSGNHISGSLPDVPGALSELTLLDLRDNQLTGTLPLSWLQEGHLLSHVSVLDVGDVWQRSVDLTNWRQQLCLQMNLYDLDVTGQQARLLPDKRQSWEIYENNSNAGNGNISDWLQEGMALSQYTLEYLVQTTNNQLTSVKDICANDDSSHILLIVCLVFGGSCLFVLAVYVGLQRYKLHGSGHPVLWRHLLHVCEAIEALYEVCYGLGGLAFYYYALITSIIVLAQVWGKWPASNNPSHGIFLSSNLSVAAIVASFLAMLKTLMELLWQAFRRNMHPMRHAASLVVGKTLAGDATQSKLDAGVLSC